METQGQSNSNSSNERQNCQKPTRDNSSSSSTESEVDSLINEDEDHELTSDGKLLTPEDTLSTKHFDTSAEQSKY